MAIVLKHQKRREKTKRKVKANLYKSIKICLRSLHELGDIIKTKMRRNWNYNVQREFFCCTQNDELNKQKEAKCLSRNRALQEYVDEEQMWEIKRHQRQVQKEEKERERVSALLKAEEEKKGRAKLRVEEEKEAEKLKCFEIEKQGREKNRQKIRENTLELRQLHSKLQAAYANKGVVIQMAENEAMKCQKKRDMAALGMEMKREREQRDTEDKEMDQRRHVEKMQYFKALQRQFQEKEQRREQAYQEFLKDKQLVDDIVQNIYGDLQMERERQMEKVKEAQEHIKEYARRREEWIRLEKERMEAENRRIMEFMKKKQLMEMNRAAMLKEKNQAKENLYLSLCKQMEQDMQQRDETERMLEEVCLEEKEEAQRLKEVEEMERKLRLRMILQQACQDQIADKEARRRQEEEEEQAFRQKMLDKFAEDDRIEQMNTNKRRMRALEHGREVQKMLEERRQQRLAAFQADIRAREMEEEKEAELSRIIEMERIEILKSHIRKLFGYIPKGLLRESDLEHFDEDIRNSFKPKQDEDGDVISQEGQSPTG